MTMTAHGTDGASANGSHATAYVLPVSAHAHSPTAPLAAPAAPLSPSAAGRAADEVSRTCELMLMAASPVRLRALRALIEGDRDLATLVGLCGLEGGDEGAVAHHLDLLRSAGLVERRVSEGDAGAPALYRITGGGRSLVRAAGVAGVRVA
jgi:DNA-binding transcriptional ArsR family regulator